MSIEYNVVSLFSGGMGLDIGLEQMGRFQVLACVEKQPSFCDDLVSVDLTEGIF